MKIVIVHNSYQRPGGEDVVARQEHQLLERAGHKVVLYLRSNWEVNSYSGIKQVALVPKAVWSTDTRKAFALMLQTEKPDLVHVHNTLVVISPSIFSVCRELGIPVVQTLHNYRLLCPGGTFFRDGKICEECVQHSLLRSIRHACYRDSRVATATIATMLTVHRLIGTWERDISRLITLTHFARNKFVEQGLPPAKLLVKPNFVYPDPMPRKTEGKYVLFAGRLTPEKRVSTVLMAFKLLRDRVPLMVVGGGPERIRLEEEAASYGLKNIIFRGQLTREQTLEAMHGARFQIFSSEWYETFGMIIVESFACGNPVLCSRLGAMQELVDDGRTGLHFNPGDPEDLAETIDRAWNDAALVRELGQQARREFEQKYTAEVNYPILMDIYRQAMNANC